MDKLARKRILQLFQYGWPQARLMAKQLNLKWGGGIFRDMIKAYRKYHMWSNQYMQEKFYTLGAVARKEIGEKYKVKNDNHDNWFRDKYENYKFLNKYTSREYDMTPKKMTERNKAYINRYNMGEGCSISTNVVIERNHLMFGTINIGKKVVLTKNVYIDYTGDVTIEDGVGIANGVIIESHHRDLEEKTKGRDVNIPTKLIIRENAYIGARAIILSSCNYVGKCARIGAGAVVTKDVPDYAVAVGVPAKVVKYLEHD